ncbi:unnamed protein product [Sphenostylis stenocarpa]|uniref:Uncharacterized protein n=1 Tax=Sphenostylis stenocarpa TaxID=92480 RepID=A0AA86VL58_9FABA|nr:unnamed protein product [Sphenostylis stenocarpa]
MSDEGLATKANCLVLETISRILIRNWQTISQKSPGGVKGRPILFSWIILIPRYVFPM